MVKMSLHDSVHRNVQQGLWPHRKTVPKAQRTRGVIALVKVTYCRSYHKFIHKSWSKFSFRVSTKLQLQNLNQTSTSIYWPNFGFKISNELQNWPNTVLRAWIKSRLKKPQPRILTKLQLQNDYQIVANTFLISNSNNINKFWVGI